MSAFLLHVETDYAERHANFFRAIEAGASLGQQVLMLSVLRVLFYPDRRIAVLWIALLLVVSNLLFSLLSLALGPAFYGYGFAVAASATTLAALAVLGGAFRHVLRDTFMQQA